MTRRMRRSALGLLVALVAGLTGCDDGRRAFERDDLPGIVGEPVAVTVDADGFTPDEVSLRSGGAIELTNTDTEAPHALRIDDGPATDELRPGETVLVVVDAAGVVEGVDPFGGAVLRIDVAPRD